MFTITSVIPIVILLYYTISEAYYIAAFNIYKYIYINIYIYIYIYIYNFNHIFSIYRVYLLLINDVKIKNNNINMYIYNKCMFMLYI